MRDDELVAAEISPPSGTVTFLFTDIEGSTRLWEEHREGMRVALADHDAVVGEEVARCGGYRFASGGDGFAIAFGSVSDALDAALAIQLRLGQARSPDGVELRSRMGVHVGRAEERDGDYFGPVLNRTARLMAVGHGGQVLLSGAAAALAADDLPEGASLVELGSHQLRDLDRPEMVSQLVHPDLEAVVGSLQAAEDQPTNLVVPVNAFIGREAECAAVAAALDADRVVTVVGPGGVGKTRLALQVASDVRPRFGDGVWVCDLAAIGDPDAVAAGVASTLGVAVGGSQPLADLCRALGDGNTLVVLDNCEHVLDSAAELAEVVASAVANVRVLATSREALAIDAEQVVQLRPLDVGNGAVELFVDRAQHIAPGVDGLNTDAVERVCRRLDGIPLAIELAAAAMSRFSVVELEQRLGEGFRSLGGARRRSASRHQTLRAAVAWSADLLDDDQRQVFAALSVFPADFDLPAAVAVLDAGDGDRFKLEDMVGDLADKSLLVVDRDAERTRFRMLETIREYATEQLDDKQRRDLLDRLASHFTEQLEDICDRLCGPREAEAVVDLEREWPNVRAAYEWAFDSGNVDHAARIVVAPRWHSYWRRLGELFGWAEATSTLPGFENHPRRADVTGQRVISHIVGGDLDQARALGAQALTEEGDTPALCARMAHGFTLTALNESDEMTELMDASIELAQTSSDLWWEGLLTYARTTWRQWLGGDDGPVLLDRAHDIANHLDNPSLRAGATWGQAQTHYMLGDLATAVSLARAAIEIGTPVDNPGYTDIPYRFVLEFDTNLPPEQVLGESVDLVSEWNRRGYVTLAQIDLCLAVLALEDLDRLAPSATLAGYLAQNLQPSTFTRVFPAPQRALSLLERHRDPDLNVSAAHGAHMSLNDAIALAQKQVASL